ncbi:MAG: hypothetical protein MUF35_03575 [Candidatus Nanopelagicales bacterium]|jgi:hypothetical protein|nr:hypothetical protein [Candidatus Nanopelagicales bacterium]
MGGTLVVLGCAAAVAVVAWLAYEPVRRAALARSERPHPLSGRRAALVGGAIAACIAGCLLVAVDASRPGGLIQLLGVPAQVVPMGVSVVLGGCLALLPWQPDWVSAELRRLALALTAITLVVFAIGAASTSWLLVMLIGVAAFAGLASVLRPTRAPDGSAAPEVTRRGR